MSVPRRARRVVLDERAKQFYYCFGCQPSGNALTFLVEYQRGTFPETVETVEVRLRLEAPRSGVRESGA